MNPSTIISWIRNFILGVGVNKPYRRCVLAVVRNKEGLYLVGERAGKPGSWQLPQGGIDSGEQPRQALVRELREEVGCGDVRFICEADDWVSYDFPMDISAPIAAEYCGQRQLWFLVEFLAGKSPDLQKADGEFSALGWMPRAEILEGIIAWKRSSYESGFKYLGLEK